MINSNVIQIDQNGKYYLNCLYSKERRPQYNSDNILFERAPPQTNLACFKSKSNKCRGALSKNTMFYCNRPVRLTQCCTQFKSPGDKILCVLYLHYNVAFTFK